MTIAESLPALASIGAVGTLAIKTPQLLKEIYGDLAKPGVVQVGKALETVLNLGNNALLPLRLLNETCRRFEEQKFESIANRFKDISVDDIIDVSPEIGVPILEKLSYTDDQTLRMMFIELLAKASSKSEVELAHPAFVNIIENMSPDEAVFLKEYRATENHPYILLVKKMSEDGSFSTLNPTVVIPPNGIKFSKNIPIYLSNLQGLGLITVSNDAHIPGHDGYTEIIEFIRKQIPEVVEGSLIEFENVKPIGSIIASKGVIRIEPFGKRFQEACIRD